MDMEITALQAKEKNYTYSQSQQIGMQTGLIGHLRADFDGSGQSFYSTWFDFRRELKSQEFKDEFDKVIYSLRNAHDYVDKNGKPILEHDVLLFDNGEQEEVFRLQDGSLGVSVSNPAFMKAYPNTDEHFTSLFSSQNEPGVHKVMDAVVDPEHSPQHPGSLPFAVGSILKSRSTISKFFYAHPEMSFAGNYTKEFGLRVNTKDHAYLLRLNPMQGDYNLYCYCYRRDWLDRHLQNAEKGIRFVYPGYKERFRLADGDKVRIIHPGGDAHDYTARYIDDYHVELEGSYGSNLYHICELAEMLERNNTQDVIPLRASLPDQCYSTLLETGEVIILKKGETGYYKTDIPFTTREEAQQIVDQQNKKLGVTKAQESAMKTGSMFGFAVPGADPVGYDEKTGAVKTHRKDRSDAR